MINQVKRTRAMSLIEVLVSASVVTVVAVGYTALYKAQDVQRTGTEELVLSMELASRQLEFLRTGDATSAAAPFNNAPGTASGYLGATCIPVPYVGARNLEEAGAGTLAQGEWLKAGNSYLFAANSAWVIGTGAATPVELTMPAEMVSKGYSVEVRAARVRSSTVLTSSIGQFENLLIHYQVTVRKAGRTLLMVPYIRAVTIR